MSSRTTQNLIPAVVIVAGFAAIFMLTGFLDRTRPRVPDSIADGDLALEGSRLKGFALGFEGLIADWYWLQSLQYVGDKLIKAQEKGVTVDIENLKPINPRLLYPILENATNLDPKFMAAYSYGAIVLPAIDPELAIKLTEKGIRENPDQWRLLQHLGYIYWRLGRYDEAAEAYERGSRVPGAPVFFKFMVAQMKNQGGSRETARKLYEQMLASAEDNETRQVAEIRLAQLDSIDEREAIQKALDDFKTRSNRCVNSWSEIMSALSNVRLDNGKELRGDRNGNLVDPTGIPYILDRPSCRVLLDTKTSKIPAE